MKKISSSNTFFYKRIFPALWFGFIGLFFIVSVVLPSSGSEPKWPFVIMPFVMAGFGYFLMKKFVFDLMDEVYDAGDCLIVKNGGQQEQINLKDIKNVNYIEMSNPPRVTLSLRRETAFGHEVSFSLPASWFPFKKNPEIQRLIDRVDEARGQK